MKVQNISPEFLISENKSNPIIKRKLIAHIHFNEFNNMFIEDPLKTIRFCLKDKEEIFWRFEFEHEAIKEYTSIIESLNKTMIGY